MNHHITRAIVAFGLLFATAHAMAIPVLRQYNVVFYQSNSNLVAGLSVDAQTSAPKMSVAGGYTLNCQGSSLSIVAQRVATGTGFTGVHLVVTVPAVTPTTYPVLGWSSIPAASCTQCTLQHKYEARDETTTSASIGFLGTGVNFTLTPTGQLGSTGTAVLGVCKGGQPQCCTRGCQIQ